MFFQAFDMDKELLGSAAAVIEDGVVEAPKRKRRTKAEIEADNAAALASKDTKVSKAKVAKEAKPKAVKEVKAVKEAKAVKEVKEVKPKAAKKAVTEIVEAVAENAAVVAEKAAVVAEQAAAEVAEQAVVETSGISESGQEDFASKSAEQLCDLLAVDIQNMPLNALRVQVESIKVAFYKLVRVADEARRAAFIADGGDADSYIAQTTDIEARFKSLLMLYRERRDSILAASEEQKEANYKAKEAIIEELKALIGSTETMGQTFAAFRELQNRWKEIGIVPLALTKDLWERYHHHAENFYNFIKINKELRDIDLRRNFEAKGELCVQAEALMENPSAIAAFNELQKLHDQYRELGPVGAEFKEQLWERFKAASGRINKRHQEHYDIIKVEQERNLALKAELCDKVESIASMPFTSVKEYNGAQDQITEFQKVWRTIGFAPKRDNNKIYDRFRAACDKFFAAKRSFFGTIRGEMDDNLQAKTDLCVQAEALMDSEDWKGATESILDLQRRWKESGSVSRKHSDAIWRRFRSACDKFFERKGLHFKTGDTSQAENLAAKQAILVELEGMAASDALSFDSLKDVMQRWGAIGFVPFKQKQAIGDSYKKAVDGLFDILRKAEGSTRIEKFKERARGFNESGRGSTEREKLVAKLRTLDAEIKLLENNIGFFAGGASSLVADVQIKIDKARVEHSELKAKIKLLDK